MDKWKSKMQSIAMILLIIVMFISLYKLCNIFWGYYVTDKMYDKTIEHYVVENKKDKKGNSSGNKQQSSDRQVTSEDDLEEENLWYKQIQVNLNELQKINSDIIGWIYFENEDISYPIMHSDNNEDYIRTTYLGETATAGAIFMESNNSSDFSDLHTIIYGHNMRDLSMFGKLRYYKTKEGYYSEHKYFQIITNDKICRYEIFAYKDVASTSNIYTIYTKNAENFSDFVQTAIIDGSYIGADNSITDDKQVITLSTCATEDNRFIVSAVKVAEYEMENGDL